MSKISYSPKNAFTGGPYSPVIEIDNLIFISGQGTYDIDKKVKYLGDIKRQTELAMNNVKRAIESAGIQMEDIIKINLFVKMGYSLQEIDMVYEKYFQNKPYPARSILIVPDLPGGMGIEIDAIAFKGN